MWDEGSEHPVQEEWSLRQCQVSEPSATFRERRTPPWWGWLGPLGVGKAATFPAVPRPLTSLFIRPLQKELEVLSSK